MAYIDGHDRDSDLGSWVCSKVSKDNTYGDLQVREYFGLSTDVAKLPTYDDLATGSSAYCVDNGDLYMSNAVGKIWGKQYE